MRSWACHVLLASAVVLAALLLARRAGDFSSASIVMLGGAGLLTIHQASSAWQPAGLAPLPSPARHAHTQEDLDYDYWIAQLQDRPAPPPVSLTADTVPIPREDVLTRSRRLLEPPPLPSPPVFSWPPAPQDEVASRTQAIVRASLDEYEASLPRWEGR